MTDTKTKILLLLLMVLILSHRLILLFNSKVTLFSDEAIYASLARMLYRGNISQFFHPTWPPLYPTLSVFVYYFVKNWENALRLVSIMSGVAILVPLYYLVKKEFTTLHAIFFSITVSFLLPLLRMSIVPLSDMLATFLTISSITLIFYWCKKQRINYLCAASFLTGLNFLTRSEGLMFFYLTIAYLTLYLIFKKKFNQLKVVAIYIAIFFITVSPYLYTMKQKLGYWSLTFKASAQIQQWHSFKLRNNTTWSQEVVSIKAPNYKSGYFKGGLKYILEYSDWFTFWFFQKLSNWQHLFLKTFPVWFWLISLIGIIRGLKKNFWCFGYLVYVLGIGVLATAFTTPVQDIRYLAWTIPIFLFLFYSGLDIKKIRPLTVIIILAASLTFTSFSREAILQPIQYARGQNANLYQGEILAVSAFINQHKKVENPKIVMRYEGVEFYTDGQTIYTPQELSANELIKYGQQKDADYLVVWKRELIAEKNYAILFDPKAKFPELTKEFEYPQDHPEIIVYSLEKIF